jgi:putative ABC transport system ATP-binding protein
MKPEPILSVTSISRRFGRGTTAVRAVRDVTLDVFPGEVISIMGPSGSGKSTLLSMMGGMLVPDTGEVAIAGRSLANLRVDDLTRVRRTSIGFVFQNFNLLKALSAVENVEVGLHLSGLPRREVRQQALGGLDEVGLAHCAHRLPRDLSGGEQQRVAIARALAPAPALILADEPTGNLDSANGRAAVDMLRAHAHHRGAGVVVVTHDHRVGGVVDRQLWMEDGVLRESDHVEENGLQVRSG